MNESRDSPLSVMDSPKMTAKPSPFALLTSYGISKRTASNITSTITSKTIQGNVLPKTSVVRFLLLGRFLTVQ